MDTTELMTTVDAEGLDAPVLLDSGRLHDDAVVLSRVDNVWCVYLVNERHSPIATTVKKFETESDALEHVLLKLRQVAASRRSSTLANVAGPQS